MAHLNVRFYGSRFSEAEAVALARTDLVHRCSTDDDIRFLHELPRGSTVQIQSTRQSDRDFLHRLSGGEGDGPAATLEAHYALEGWAVPAFNSVGWKCSGLRVLGPQFYSATGELTREALLGMANQAAVHMDFDKHRLRDEAGDLLTGTAVVACRIRRTASATVGARLEMGSRISSVGRTSLRLEHRLTSELSSAVIAEIEVTSVFFDMKTRRPCPVPDGLRAQVASNAQMT